MSRVVYILIGTKGATGGHKMILRHVEALNEMGFDAVAYIPDGAPEPKWLQHNARLQVGGTIHDTDFIVIPEDALAILKRLSNSKHRKVVFCQNHFYAAAFGLGLLTTAERDGYRDFMACSNTAASWLMTFFSNAVVTVVPAFADERQFVPGPKSRLIACTPRKRELELRCIHYMFSRSCSQAAHWRWAFLRNVSEQMVAETFRRASVFLSLSRLEGLGVTTLEAMSSGCVVAGFRGQGGNEYATGSNGYWADDDDCDGCVSALLKATTTIDTNSHTRELVVSAAKATANQYTYSHFLSALKAFWQPRVT